MGHLRLVTGDEAEKQAGGELALKGVTAGFEYDGEFAVGDVAFRSVHLKRDHDTGAIQFSAEIHPSCMVDSAKDTSVLRAADQVLMAFFSGNYRRFVSRTTWRRELRWNVDLVEIDYTPVVTGDPS